MVKKSAAVALFLAFACALAVCTCANDVPRMTVDELKAMLDRPDIRIVDVRASSGWEKSKAKIKGAVREDPGAVEAWMGKYSKGGTIVLYCA